MEKLKNSKVAVFGIGGVGGYAVEALARGGVGALGLFDSDRISLTNINRQIHATVNNIGEYKTESAKKRVLDINPDAEVDTCNLLFLPETSGNVDFTRYDYIIDAIDNISGKIELVLKAREYEVPIISAMGAGNKVRPEMFEVADIYETQICPLARVMRRELRKRGVEKLKTVYSKEPPIRQTTRIPGSVSFVPPVMGFIIAGEVIKDLTGYKNNFKTSLNPIDI